MEEKIKKLLKEPICNMCQAFADDFCEANADQRQKMGMKSQIIRTVMGDCCEWCKQMAGAHDYNSADNTFFRRHDHCKCTIKIKSSKVSSEINNQLEIEKNIRIKNSKLDSTQKNDIIKAKTRETVIALKQESNRIKIPKDLENNFGDYEPLALTKLEHDTLSKLHELTLKNIFEYGAVIRNEKIVKQIRTDRFEGQVGFDLNELGGANYTLLHSHTNQTPLSRADIAMLCREKISSIAVVASNGDIYVVRRNNNNIPTKSEFDAVVKWIEEDVDHAMLELYESAAERNYAAIKETMFRICRHFKWRMEGGKIDGK